MIVGIDLGTTNSLIGVWKDGASVLIPNALGSVLTPSVVSADDKGHVIVGQAARDRLVTHPHSTAAAFKRAMGTNRQVNAGGNMYRAEELSSFVLKSLKADAEAFLGESVTEAVITVPAYFNDTQRKATKAAGELAGLKVDRLLTEPTAAALAYGFAGEDAEDLVLVIDLGGGTLDISLLHSFEGIMEVKATAGDIWLGGEDFTHAIAAAFMENAGRAAGIAPFSENAAVHGQILRQAEVAKRALSDTDRATMDVVFQDKKLSWTIDRDAFERACEPILTRVRQPLERALRDSRVSPDAITRVVFAGGATRMPMFKRLISRLLRQLPVQHINPDEVVARGAAVRAGLIARGAGLEERVLTDVSPFTLGVEVMDVAADGSMTPGVFLPIIERNTLVPASRSHVVQTVTKNQSRLNVRVFQGESRLVRDNVLLGQIEAMVLPRPAGEEKVDIRFTYDTSGLLEVDATSLSTRDTWNLVIEGNPGVLGPNEIARRREALKRLKVHPRDDAQNLALLARAERLYEENLGDMRTQIANAIGAFTAVIERQDPAQIDETRTQFRQFLDAIDRSLLV